MRQKVYLKNDHPLVLNLIGILCIFYISIGSYDDMVPTKYFQKQVSIGSDNYMAPTWCWSIIENSDDQFSKTSHHWFLWWQSTYLEPSHYQDFKKQVSIGSYDDMALTWKQWWQKFQIMGYVIVYVFTLSCCHLPVHMWIVTLYECKFPSRHHNATHLNAKCCNT